MRRTLVIHKANSYVRLTDFKPELVKQVLIPFCSRHFYRVQKVPIPGGGPNAFKRTVSHVFARFNADKTELRFNVEKLPELIELMKANGYAENRILIQDETVIPGMPADIKLKNPNIKPRNELQEDYIEFMTGSTPVVVNNATTGFGKAQPLSSKIKIPDGWTTMGEIKLGDVVITPDGTSTKVVGVYPQGNKDIYRITFADGRTADCCEEHLWKVYDCSIRNNENRWNVIDTKEIIRRFDLSQPRMYIPLIKPEIGEDRPLSIDPYLLGVLIGDGCFRSPQISVSLPDEFIKDKIIEVLPKGMVLNKRKGSQFEYGISHSIKEYTFQSLIKELKLINQFSYEKHIPEEYLHGSYSQRLSLLQGLMDTDGTSNTGGSCQFSTSSEKLKEDVLYLVRSLGGIAKSSDRFPTYTHNGEKKNGRKSYVIGIRLPCPSDAFTLPRKKERMQEINQYSENLKLRIIKVELVRKEEAQCIMVDHPDHLYITDDFIVTHNTFMAIYTAYLLQKRTLITVLPRYVDIWVKAIAEFLDVHPTDILIVDKHSVEETHKAMKEGLINPSFIILPLTKIDVYLKRTKDDPSLPCLDEVYRDLGCGYRIIDEAHESIYSVYMSLMFGNHAKTAALSATLQGDDDFINGIYNQIFPPKSYLRPPEYTKYIHVIAYTHRMDVNKYRINTKGFGGYSHVKFEQAIMKNKYVFEQYYLMLAEAFKVYYFDTYRDGQKAMWFFATIEMCEMFLERLKLDHPELDAIVFTGEQSKKKETKTAYREHQVVVTTPGSCGTGKDIPMLYVVFSPIAVSSSQRNDQMVGRTRPIDKWWPDLDPIFVYFVCPDIPKQVDYHRKRKIIFDKKMKQFTLIDSGSRI